MSFALNLFLAVLSSVVFVQADVSHLGYSRYSGPRVQTLRLQRLESNPTPYPAAGYRPNREFNLPRDQPLFPLSNQQGNRPQVNSGFDILSEPQRPQLVYGSPKQEQPRFPQQNRPQNSNGFNSLAEPQQPDFVEQSQFSGVNQRPQNNNNNNNFHNGFNGGFNNLAEPQQPQQNPDLIYGAPNAQDLEAQTGFNNLAETQQPQQPQRPQYNYNAPSARLREILVAHLKQAEQQLQQQSHAQGYRQSQLQSQSQQQQQFAPQTVYSVPSQQQQQSQAESQTSLAAQKPARLTDNREDREDESDVKASETAVDIETTAKGDGKKNANQTASTPVATAATGLFNYYPAAAFSYVQPFSAAYVQPAAYTVGSPFLPQQYALATAAPAQLQAW